MDSPSCASEQDILAYAEIEADEDEKTVESRHGFALLSDS